MFYTIGAYLGKHKEDSLLKGKNAVIMCVVYGVLLIFSAMAFDTIGTKIQMFDDRSEHFYQRNSIIVVALAIALLSAFSTIKPFSNKFVNIVSSCTFGVYHIHDNAYVRDLLWNNWFNNSDYANSNFLIIHFVVSVTIVFISCLGIEFIRKYIIEKYFLKKPNEFINSYFNSVFKRINGIVNCFIEKD